MIADMAAPHDLEAQLFQALASPVRVRMLELLRAAGRLTVSEMQQRLGIEAANASQHLRVLRDRGLVERRRQGTSISYAIADPALHALLDDARRLTQPRAVADAPHTEAARRTPPA